MELKQKPKVSVLVPCYNVEKFLEQCLDSVVNQTLKDMEIICINDGSTDSTLSIIKKYAAKDNRIVVIDKPNEGYGKSMNRGLDAATGEYIGIVESDDWAEADMFERLSAIADAHNVDVVRSNFFSYKTKQGEKNELIHSLPENDLDCVINPHERTDIFFSPAAIWSALYRRKFLVDNDIRFLESPGASYQDTAFNFKVWLMAKSAWLTGAAYLHYRCDNENSSVKSSGKIFCVCDEWQEVERYAADRNLLSKDVCTLMSHVKLNGYKWNMNRLADDAKKQFAKRFAHDFKPIVRAGCLNRKYIDDVDWFNLLSIVYYKNPLISLAGFCVRIIAPIYRVRVRGRKRLYNIFWGRIRIVKDLPNMTI